MNRRHFLFGTIGAAAGGLLLNAPADAVDLFQPTLAETIAVSRVSRIPDVSVPSFEPFTIGETLFNGRGVPVVVVQSIRISRDVEHIESRSGDRYAIPGFRRISVDVEPLFQEFTRRG